MSVLKEYTPSDQDTCNIVLTNHRNVDVAKTIDIVMIERLALVGASIVSCTIRLLVASCTPSHQISWSNMKDQWVIRILLVESASLPKPSLELKIAPS